MGGRGNRYCRGGPRDGQGLRKQRIDSEDVRSDPGDVCNDRVTGQIGVVVGGLTRAAGVLSYRASVASLVTSLFGGALKDGIHPEYVECRVICSCGETFVTRSTKPEIRVEICSACHPFYTGKQKLVDTAGRVERFNKKYRRVQKKK